MSDLEQFDAWLTDTGPAALVIREHLMPVEGHDGVLFPATFAASEDKAFKGGYNIDEFTDGKNVCLIDSVGSQANRIEPLFAKGDYARLVPQVVVKAGDKRVNLLDAGHRAGDAIVRCSALQQKLQEAFKAVLNGDAEPLAKIAPTSLVFGAWDSRDTQAKLPRLIASTIRALDVRQLTRSAAYVPAVDYVDEGLLEEPEGLRTTEGKVKTKNPLSQRGFLHDVQGSATHGGVIAAGGIRRDSTLHLAALRLLAAGSDEQKTMVLRRYVLGLALTAFTHAPSGYLRQGCNLVLDPEKPREFKAVYGDGRREDAALTHPDALAYAKAATEAFGIGEDREVEFDKESARKDVADAKDKKKKRAGADAKKAE
ncbi:MAG: type I-U CRISPR-associated RAMP protein Csb1/Cas7u [Candidatus Eisenbacteria bacterium]|nr:type I-U CRISPR-associated RAMP protein Csb1/Cas7u [Candidatus Eisenbacteria bacterium]